jgi:hypothetical protein
MMLHVRWLAMLALIAMTAPAVAAQQTKPVSKKSMFAGSESRLAAYHIVWTDCSAGPLPDYRMVTKPTKGNVRLEPVTIPIDRAADSGRAHCNGKPTSALGLFYRAPDGFVGVEKLTIDVDWRDGNIDRYIYEITVR